MRNDTESPVDGVVVEWAPFRTRAGVDEATVLATAETIQRDFLEHQPGFLRRELLRGADGGWVDLVYWADEQSAAAAMRSAESSPVCHAYFHLMQGGDSIDVAAGVLHLHRVRVYAASAEPDRAERV